MEVQLKSFIQEVRACSKKAHVHQQSHTYSSIRGLPWMENDVYRFFHTMFNSGLCCIPKTSLDQSFWAGIHLWSYTQLAEWGGRVSDVQPAAPNALFHTALVMMDCILLHLSVILDLKKICKWWTVSIAMLSENFWIIDWTGSGPIQCFGCFLCCILDWLAKDWYN